MNAKQLGQKRLDNTRGVLSSRGLDAIVLANLWTHSPQEGDYSLYYTSNLLRRYTECFLILTPDDCCVWVTEWDLNRAKEESWLSRIELLPPGEQWGYSGEEFAGLIAKQLQELVGKDEIRIGVNGRFLPSAVGLGLDRNGILVEDVWVALEQSRLIKDEQELEYLRKACQIVDTGVHAFLDSVREGITEHELAALAEFEMKKNGAENFWWKTLMSSGPEAERWLASPSERTIRDGDLVVMDFTPVYCGYAGDIARTFVFGTASAEQRQVYDLAERALHAASSVLTEGVTYGEVMEAAAKQVEGAPYEEFYAGAGHGIGLYDDTYPIFLASIPKMKTLPVSMLEAELKAGMVIALEIIYTIPGLGGMRLEDNYIVTKDAPELLTHAPLRVEA